MDSNFIDRVTAWNLAAGNTADSFNVRQTAMYIGLQLEEMAEKLEAIAGCEVPDNEFGSLIKLMHDYSGMFKVGEFDADLEQSGDLAAMLDADCDIAVVTVGAMMSIGADIHGALDEVCTSNESKSVECKTCAWDGKADYRNCPDCNGRGWILQKDETGKIQKCEDYQAPQLEQFLKV